MINTHNDKLIIALGISASILLFFATFSYELKEEKLHFLSSANNAFNKVEFIFSTLDRINKELSSRFYLADEPDKDEFRFFAQSHITQNPFIEKILFAEKVKLKDKSRYELNFKNEGYSGFSIKPFPENSFNDSFSSDTLFPIKYIEPYNVKNSQWFGRDVLTYPVIRNAVQATLDHSNSLIYTTDSDKDNSLYATRALYSGDYGHTSNKNFQDIFGLLLYKIKIRDIAPEQKSDFVTIFIDGNTVLKEGTNSPNGLFAKTFKSTREVNLADQKVLIEISRTKNLLFLNLTLPVIVFLLGLLLTLFVWQIIHSHMKINQLLSKQKGIIENEVLLKTEELRTQANELTAAYNRQLELTEELEAFCYSVSHDLRAPLRSINGFSQILHEDYSDVLDAAAKGYLTRTCAAAGKMGNIIDDLLSLSRIARSNIETKTINLSEIAEKSVHAMRGYEPDRQVSVDIQKNITAHGNPKLLQIAFDNLISNAWKYSKKTPDAHIEFGMKKNDDGAVYYIRDNGVGFDMRYKSKLFTAFQRLHHTSEFEGSGIGLATTQRIIQKHHGQIWANSKPGKGATFYFTLGKNINS